MAANLKITNLSATSGNSYIILNWTAPPTTPLVYHLYWTDIPSFNPGDYGVNALSIGQFVNTYKVEGLTNGTTYYFKLEAVDVELEVTPYGSTTAAPENIVLPTDNTVSIANSTVNTFINGEATTVDVVSNLTGKVSGNIVVTNLPAISENVIAMVVKEADNENNLKQYLNNAVNSNIQFLALDIGNKTSLAKIASKNVGNSNINNVSINGNNQSISLDLDNFSTEQRVIYSLQPPTSGEAQLYFKAIDSNTNSVMTNLSLPIEINIPSASNTNTLEVFKSEDNGISYTNTNTTAVKREGTESTFNYTFTSNTIYQFRTPSAGVPCLVRGTRVLTSNGYKAVETLSTGDRIISSDGRPLAFKAYKIAFDKTTTKNAPYLIKKNAYGPAKPSADIQVSPLHAIQMRKGVWDIPLYSKNSGVSQVNIGEPIEYYHIELPNYFTDNLVCEGLVTESYGRNQIVPGKIVYRQSASIGGYTRNTHKLNIKSAKI